MKILESAPNRYDLGIRLLTWGRLDAAYDRLASHIGEGQEVLDMGCGTGALTLRAARRGAKVKGIDINPQMLEIARTRIREEKLHGQVALHERGVAELDGEASALYSVVMSGLCLSELSTSEQTFTLGQVYRILKPGGLLLIADEVQPFSLLKRGAHHLMRFPLIILTYLLTQTTTRAVKGIEERIVDAGFLIEGARRSNLESFVELIAVKPQEERP
jgi:demethylmenaquinone methyltransferase/2-methoxy-6-polyprenyl-1,4-benzoquinol methylase